MIGLPVKQLKRYARELGADVTDCVEKSDVVDSIGKKAKHAHWYIDIEDACILLRSVHEPKTKLEKASARVTHGTLTLCDLAGSEDVKRSGSAASWSRLSCPFAANH